MFTGKVQFNRKSRFVRLSEQNSPHYHLKVRILDEQTVSAKNGAKRKQNGANFKINNTYSNITIPLRSGNRFPLLNISFS